MKKLIASLACVIGAAAPVQANEVYRLLDAQKLTQTVRATGTTVLYDQPRCYEKNTYGYYHPASDTLVICVENHDGDFKELGDTLRHESIHVAQACNGHKPILDWATISKYSTTRILSIVQRYPISHQHIEYEAFTAAYAMSNTQVAKVVHDFCF